MSNNRLEAEDSNRTLRQLLKIMKVHGFNYLVMSIRNGESSPFQLYKPFKYLTFLDDERVEVELRNGMKIVVKRADIVRIEILKVKEDRMDLMRE